MSDWLDESLDDWTTALLEVWLSSDYYLEPNNEFYCEQADLFQSGAVNGQTFVSGALIGEVVQC